MTNTDFILKRILKKKKSCNRGARPRFSISMADHLEPHQWWCGDSSETQYLILIKNNLWYVFWDNKQFAKELLTMMSRLQQQPHDAKMLWAYCGIETEIVDRYMEIWKWELEQQSNGSCWHCVVIRFPGNSRERLATPGQPPPDSSKPLCYRY